MEKNDRSKYRKSAILSGILALTMLTSACANASKDVTVIIKEKKEDKDVKPVVVAIEEATWVEFDANVHMYKVDLDKFLKDKLKLSRKVLENDDVINLIEIIREELGEDFYTEDKNGNKLCNLEGKAVTISASSEGCIFVKFCGSEDSFEGKSLKYEIHVNQNGKTEIISRSKEELNSKVSKYFVIYSGNKEYTRSILLREDNTKYLSIGLHEAGTIFDSCSISFSTEMAEASIKLSKEDYDTLYEIMLLYSDSDNLYEFLSDNIDLLTKYLDLIKEENAEYYEYLCSLINEYIEKAKILRYE